MRLGNLSCEDAINRLAGNFGFTPRIQQLIGALILAWGLFECNLESSIWQLNGEDPEGNTPTTDGKPVSEWITQYETAAAAHVDKISMAAALIATSAKDLADFRNTIAHGWAVPVSVGGPGFVKNPRWFNEKRKRKPMDAHTTEQTLNMAIESTEIINRARALIFQAVQNPADIDDFLPDEIFSLLQRAKNMSGEIRHLTELMNNGKY